MAVSDEAKVFACDLFSGLGVVTVRAMFGGAGIYHDGVMFGLIAGDDAIYLKAEGTMAKAMSQDGSEPFLYHRDGKVRKMSYWSLPEAAWEDPDLALIWARRAWEIARLCADD